jgi:acetyl-CoA carboxylase biotin carboxyl carrier protein
MGTNSGRSALGETAKHGLWCAPMATNVPAHITGTVWKIEVKVGEEVAEGQTLVILESMKMEMPVEAPRGGKVAAVDVTEGQAVDEGDTVVTLE